MLMDYSHYMPLPSQELGHRAPQPELPSSGTLIDRSCFAARACQLDQFGQIAMAAMTNLQNVRLPSQVEMLRLHLVHPGGETLQTILVEWF